MREIGLMDVGGFRVGHAQNRVAATGCTVLLPDEAAPCGAEVRGGGPASRETQLLQPQMDCQAVHGILLAGGSAFGLDAAGGVQRYLEERDIGFDTGVAKVPLVCQSGLFDLGLGDAKVRPMPPWRTVPVKMRRIRLLYREMWGPVPGVPLGN